MLLLHRIAHFLYKKNIPFFPKLMEALIFLIFNSRIPSDVSIGKGSKFAYQGLSTLLVKGTVIGENCIIGMRATTGRKFPYKNVPRIGDKVWIGVNSVIIGPVIIEDNVIIAPNSVVNKSVPEYKIVGGNPAKIIGDVRNLDYDVFSNPKYKEGFSKYLN
ncbi:serine O-acetyltransferase [Oceanihabitans sediminis]|uniref:Serine acetyltransferase n=1 Tax=Oceanihabitans sediminis TaxID=1812012 RepID=A0A368P7U9_9FLAO|nr:DapH/DapD/GlmU-related protein [Oceanihabitans sediminis]RBP27055.1 serine O-acetyltransferase [Oceanihabitans sediminis]RCU58628.1 serine acetyltransferase [Oceanihabitans sediminis]